MRPEQIALRTAAVRVPRGLGRRVSCRAGRGLPGFGSTSDALLQSSQNFGRADPADRGVWALHGAALTYPRCPTRRSRHRPGRFFWADRAREGRTARNHGEELGAPTCNALSGAPTTCAKTRTALQWRGRSIDAAHQQSAAGDMTAPSRPSTTRTSSTDRESIPAPYDLPEVIARLGTIALRRVQAAVRHDARQGFARLHGFCGSVANNGVLFSESALKATPFIALCNLAAFRSCSSRTTGHGGLHYRSRRHREGGASWSRGRDFVVPKSRSSSRVVRAGNTACAARAYERGVWMWRHAPSR